MKSLTESPALLSVHAGTAGQYILRVTDVKQRNLIVGVTKLLTDASSFVVITPTDIKVFAVEGQSHLPLTESEVDLEMQAAIDQEEAVPIPNAELPEEKPQTPVRRKKYESVSGRDEQCQRCAGEGKTKVLLEGGQASETACPICKGTGVMKRYGARR